MIQGYQGSPAVTSIYANTCQDNYTYSPSSCAEWRSLALLLLLKTSTYPCLDSWILRLHVRDGNLNDKVDVMIS